MVLDAHTTTTLKNSVLLSPPLFAHNTVPPPLFSFSLTRHRAVCDDVDMFLDVPSPLTGDLTISLSVGVLQCEIMDPDTNPEEVTTVVVEGGSLTIASANTVQ